MHKYHVREILSKEEKNKLVVIVTLEEFGNKSKRHHLDQIVKNYILTLPSLDQPDDKLRSIKKSTVSMIHKRPSLK